LWCFAGGSRCLTAPSGPRWLAVRSGRRGARRAGRRGRTPPCSYGSGFLRSGTEVKGRWRRARAKRMEDAARGRAGCCRGRPRRARGGRGVGPSEVAREAPLWCVRAALPARGCRGGPPALAGARSRDDVRVPGGRRAARVLQAPSRGRGPGAVGQARLAVSLSRSRISAAGWRSTPPRRPSRN